MNRDAGIVQTWAELDPPKRSRIDAFRYKINLCENRNQQGADKDFQFSPSKWQPWPGALVVNTPVLSGARPPGGTSSISKPHFGNTLCRSENHYCKNLIPPKASQNLKNEFAGRQQIDFGVNVRCIMGPISH